MSDAILAQGLQALSGTLGQWAKRNQDQDASDTLLRAFDQSQQGQLPAPSALAAPQPQAGPATAAAAPPQQQSGNASTSAKLPSFAAAQGTPLGSKVFDLFKSQEAENNLPPGYLARTSFIESGWKPTAVSPMGANGPFQFTKGTAAQYGVSDPTDWAQSTVGAAKLGADNANTLRQALGREPTGAELYLAHQQGAGGASALLANPNARAGDIVGDQAVRVNGGDPNMPAGMFASKWTNKYNQLGGGGSQTAIASAPQQPAASSLGYALPTGNAPAQQAISAAIGGDPAQGTPSASPYGGLNLGAFGQQPAQQAAPGGSPDDPSDSPAPSLPTFAQGGALGYAPSGSGASVPSGAVIVNGPNGPRRIAPSSTDTGRRSAPPTGSQGYAQQQQAPVPGGAAPAGQAYGSQPLNVNGRMMTRQQAEDADESLNVDHTDYDYAAARAGIIGNPNAAPPFMSGVGASPAPAPGLMAANAAPASQDQPAPSPTQPMGMQAGSGSPAQPASAVPVGPRTTGLPADAIRTLLANPDTRDIGLKLWEQSATGKNYGFMKDDTTGDIIATDPTAGSASLVFRGLPKPMSVTAGSSLVDPRNPGKALFTAPADPKDTAPKWGVLGEDQYGRKQYGYPPPPGASPPPPMASPTGPDTSNLHGSAYLSTLDPGMATQVQAILDGRAPYPSGMQLTKPYGQMIATAVTQADPTFESGNATARVKVRNEFESGGPSSPAGMITAGNTAIQHLGELSDAAEALNNRALPAWNSVTNAITSHTGGSAVTNFNTVLGHFVEEAVKFYRGSGGTEADVQRDMDNLNANMSPEQLHSAIQQNVRLLQGKINALQDRWRQGMGPLPADFPIVQPKSQAAINTIAKRAGVALTNDVAVPGQQQPQSNAAPAAPGARVQVRSAVDYQALPSGTRYLDPTGTPRVKP